MSDTVDTETMKVSEAADPVSSPKDNTTKSEVLDQSQSSRDEHSSNNKSNVQVRLVIGDMFYKGREIYVHPRNPPVTFVPYKPLTSNVLTE